MSGNAGLPMGHWEGDAILHAAGVLLVAPGGVSLFLRRNYNGDHEGEWGIPGGKIEPGENAMQAAVRELKEETGITIDPGQLKVLDRTAKDGVDFVTFFVRIPQQLPVTVNEEHDGFAWAPFGMPPEPTHPGVKSTVKRRLSGKQGADARTDKGNTVRDTIHYPPEKAKGGERSVDAMFRRGEDEMAPEARELNATTLDADFNEADHPRDHGKFTSGAGHGADPKETKSTSTRSHGSGTAYPDSAFTSKGGSKEHMAAIKEATKHIPNAHRNRLQDLKFVSAGTLSDVMSKSQMKAQGVSAAGGEEGVAAGFASADGKTIGVIENKEVPGGFFGGKKKKLSVDIESTILHEVGHALDKASRGSESKMYGTWVDELAPSLSKDEKFNAAYFLGNPSESYAELYATAFSPGGKSFFGGLSRERTEEVFARPLKALRNASLG